jgi:hypothetical protein
MIMNIIPLYLNDESFGNPYGKGGGPAYGGHSNRRFLYKIE